jgi:hypothetical protein
VNPHEMIAILALVGYAVYRQTRVSEVLAEGRFKLALIYGIVGLCVGGFDLPSGAAGIAMLIGSLALSVVIGLWRGQLTRLWVGSDGRIMMQGTAVTVGLFLAMVVAKFGLGTWAYFAHIDDGEGLGEILVMIALMVAAQAQIVWRRAEKLPASRVHSIPPSVAAR